MRHLASPTVTMPTSPAPEKILLAFQNVAAGYGARRVLEDISFTLEPNDYLALVGGNGAGKTTLLRTLLGLLPPLGGRIHFPAARPRFGYVPQLSSVDEIFPLSALEIVKMGLFGQIGALRRPGKIHEACALRTLEEVGVAQYAHKLFRDLSGGQKQRTLIARALVSQPDVLILDEHTNNLDIAGEKAIMSFIDEVHARHGVAVVMVTHSLNAVANHAKHIGIIAAGGFDFQPVEVVMNSDYLSNFYGVPMQVLEIGGKKAVL